MPLIGELFYLWPVDRHDPELTGHEEPVSDYQRHDGEQTQRGFYETHLPMGISG